MEYDSYKFSIVTNFNDFFKSSLPEMRSIRSIHNNIKILLNLPTDRVQIYVAEGKRIYKFIMITPDVSKTILGWIYYTPLEKKIDLFLPETPSIPFMQWKEKKLTFKNYTGLLDRVGIDKLFNKIVNNT